MNHIVALPLVIDRAVHVGFLEVFETSLISLLIGYHQTAILTHSLSMDLRTHVTMVTQTRHSRDMSERSYSGSDTTKWSPELWTSPTCKWTVCLFWSFPNTSWRFDCFHPFQWHRFEQSLDSILFIRCWSQWLDCQTTSSSESLWHFFQLKEHMPVNKDQQILEEMEKLRQENPQLKASNQPGGSSAYGIYAYLQTREPQVVDLLIIFQEQWLQVLYLKIQNQNYLMNFDDQQRNQPFSGHILQRDMGGQRWTSGSKRMFQSQTVRSKNDFFRSKGRMWQFGRGGQAEPWSHFDGLGID